MIAPMEWTATQPQRHAQSSYSRGWPRSNSRRLYTAPPDQLSEKTLPTTNAIPNKRKTISSKSS
eukprot:2295507-Amphidinium_carterae.1